MGESQKCRLPPSKKKKKETAIRKGEIKTLSFSSFLSKGLPLLHVRSAQRAGRTQHHTKDNSHQEQRQMKDQLQRHQMEQN